MLVESSSDRTPAQKLKIAAATAVIALIVIAALVYGYQRYQRAKPASGIQQVEELGFGFRRAIIAKVNKGQSAQYPFFFYKDRPLCQIGPSPPSISPSGNYAICQDIRSGKLMLFRRKDEKLVPLTAGPFGVPSGFGWQEQEGTVEAKAGAEFSSIFNLQ